MLTARSTIPLVVAALCFNGIGIGGQQVATYRTSTGSCPGPPMLLLPPHRHLLRPLILLKDFTSHAAAQADVGGLHPVPPPAEVDLQQV